MRAAIVTRPAKKTSNRGLARAAIQRRLDDIELATVSAVRSLQMDMDVDVGVPSASVLKARRAIR